MLWFEYCVSNGKRKKWFVLYTQDNWREKWRTSGLMGLRSIPVRKKTQSATCTWFCLNKFTLSWETQVPRKTTFVTFSVLGIVYQTLKALSLWQQEPSQQKGEEVWESREVSPSVLCFHFVDHHLLNDIFVKSFSCDLHSNWNLAILEYFFSGSVCKGKSRVTVFLQICGLFLGCLWPVCLEVWLRTSRVLIRLVCHSPSFFQNHRRRLHLTASQRRHSSVWRRPFFPFHLAPAARTVFGQRPQQLEKERCSFV